MDFIRTATECGMVVWVGHTEATPELVAAGLRAGLKVAIHWSNATGNLGQPHFAGTSCPCIDEAALDYDELSAEIIPDRDGLHVHPLMARLLFKAKGANRIFVITRCGLSETG